MSKGKFRKYLFYGIGEIILIVLGILIAFTLNDWSENRKSRKVEDKILIEISNGLKQDLKDAQSNAKGHKVGIRSCNYFTDLIAGRKVAADSIAYHSIFLTRGYNSIQNRSAYESLKSKGLELIANDELRIKIIQVYEQEYSAVRKLEEEDEELSFHKMYFKEINGFIAGNLEFDENGKIKSIKLPISIAEKDRKRIQMYLWRIRNERIFLVDRYSKVIEEIEALQVAITEEFDR